ncbi:hypothetical protein CHS0354_005807 [Potamilus streckersoni]|uniref:Uncharacterized protein n=1 Tax=Potamilus streckersoni TaxID=2493646 RepID=A0AAE0SV64_9BIVA|nr:hypothetical protein CHS0354_005807 [Potamilus streckersoni]
MDFSSGLSNLSKKVQLFRLMLFGERVAVVATIDRTVEIFPFRTNRYDPSTIAIRVVIVTFRSNEDWEVIVGSVVLANDGIPSIVYKGLKSVFVLPLDFKNHVWDLLTPVFSFYLRPPRIVPSDPITPCNKGCAMFPSKGANMGANRGKIAIPPRCTNIFFF